MILRKIVRQLWRSAIGYDGRGSTDDRAFMLYRISHQTSYSYNQSVYLRPHLLRLRPRCNGWQKLHDFSLLVQPQPQGRSELIDLDGNAIVKLWFDKPTQLLQLMVTSTVETFQDNPFNFLLDPIALQLPIAYSSQQRSRLSAYLQPDRQVFDPASVELAREIDREVDGNTSFFLTTLNQRIYNDCEYIVRPTGAPWSPGLTWTEKRGSCRDFTLLFAEVCRAAGLAARFVSGYQEGDRDQEERDLHAWVEVYLPGGGWRGYDPTHGLVVSDRHIALVASPSALEAAPISGQVTPVEPIFVTGKAVETNMEFQLNIDREH